MQVHVSRCIRPNGEDDKDAWSILVKRAYHDRSFFSSTHIDITHHLFSGNCSIYTSYAALMNVNVQFDALEPSQKKYDWYWRDARENDDSRYGQHPAGIRSRYGYTLKWIKKDVKDELC